MVVSLVLAAVAAFSILLVVRGLAAQPVDILEARLAQFGDREMTLDEMELSMPLVDRVIRPFFEKIGEAVAKRTPANQLAELQDKINLAGRPYGLDVRSFLALRLFIMPPVFALLMYGLASAAGFNDIKLYALPLFGAALGFSFPKLVVDRKIKARQKEILLGLPNALDLLTISVEAGLGFDAAMARVCEKYKNALSAEFSQVLSEVRLGRPRLEALEEMGRRSHVDELNNFVQAVVQSEQLGVGIANVLRIQSEEMRRRRRQRAEEQGQKAPLKMLFPMVGCIFPTLFIVLLGPAVLAVSHSMLGGSH